MPHYLEFDGINVEKAVEKACKEMNYPAASYGVVHFVMKKMKTPILKQVLMY